MIAQQSSGEGNNTPACESTPAVLVSWFRMVCWWGGRQVTNSIVLSEQQVCSSNQSPTANTQQLAAVGVWQAAPLLPDGSTRAHHIARSCCARR